jgi:hypothetical protein
MSPVRRVLTILVLACAFVVAQAPRNDAHAGPFLLLAKAGALVSAAAAVIDYVVGDKVATRSAQFVVERVADLAEAVGATGAANVIRGTTGMIEFATSTAGAFLGLQSLPDPNDIAARAVAFANNGVLLAPFVRQFVETASQVGQQFGVRVAAEVLTLLNYVFLIWLLLQAAQMMLGMARGSEIFWNIIKRSAVYMILVAMLLGVQSGEYWRWFVQEPLQATSAMTRVLASGSESRRISNCGEGTAGDAATSAEAIVCVSERVLRGGIAAGWALIAATPFRITQPTDLAKGFVNILGGIGLCIFFGLALLYFGFFVIDVFMRVLVLAMFSPIFIALYLIEATRSVPRNAINNLLGSLFTLLGAVAVLGIVGGLIGNLVGGGPGASWEAFIRQYAQGAVNLSPSVGVADSRYWTLAFAALALIGSAKAIGGLLGGIFGGAAAGVAADKATAIAAIPVKAAVSAATLGAGAAVMAPLSMARRKMGWGK